MSHKDTVSQPDSDPQSESPESKLVAFLKGIYGIWISERPTQFAAALAYYAIFSFVPVIYITFTITELVIEHSHLNNFLIKSQASFIKSSGR